MQKIHEIRRQVHAAAPLIHCITNPISINQCANALLAVGARPMMAEHPAEVGEITASAGALLLNLGNITDVRMRSMRISAEIAQRQNIPTVIDAVGIACSTLRRDYILRLIDAAQPAAIKGNYSEIRALHDSAYRTSGVDAEGAADVQAMCRTAASLARRYRAVILASGKTDVITDGHRAVFIRNGTPQLASVTGTGCMLGALCASYFAVRRDLYAAVSACAMLGICGELAQTDRGSGSFFVNLMDNLSVLPEQTLEQHLSMEEIILENY